MKKYADAGGCQEYSPIYMRLRALAQVFAGLQLMSNKKNTPNMIGSVLTDSGKKNHANDVRAINMYRK